ncbi:MAG: metallophosphatase family protein [Gammaproteobacteria bacterium]|nr:metallophosphatase family protein [Gammaproteobacteria bacterium]
MKIAVLSDVHGNVPALEAVLEDIAAWGADQVIVNGDLLNRGPCSLAVLQCLQQELPQACLLRGNHENWLLHCAGREPNPDSPTFEIDRFAHWSVVQLGEALQPVAAWDDHLDMAELEGGSLHITHGSRLGDRKGIQPECEGEELAEKLGDPRDLFIVSHTHRAFTRRVNATLLINTGSVGQPFDGDKRASYARLQFHQGRWQGEIVRIPYARERAIADFELSGFLEEGGALTRVIFREFIEARMHVGPWRRRYLEAVKRGEIGVVESVQRYLVETG